MPAMGERTLVHDAEAHDGRVERDEESEERRGRERASVVRIVKSRYGMFRRGW